MEPWIKTLFDEQILHTAGAYFGASKTDLSLVGGFENFIYGFDLKGQSFILRISHTSHRTVLDTLAELDFVNHLALHGAPVSRPVRSNQGNLVESILAKDGSYFTASCYHKAQGERPTRNHLNPEFLFNYGKTIGTFHRITTHYQPSSGIQPRFSWDQDPLLVHAQSYLTEDDQLIYQCFKETMEGIHQLPKNKENFGLIHTDVHMGNFFIHHNELTVFDFDDCSTMHFVSDIAIALFYYVVFMKANDTEKKEKADEFMTHFMKGYLSTYALSKSDYLEIPRFLKLRELVLYIVFHRSSDLKTDGFARTYVESHRDLIIKGIPVIDLDFEKYYR
jgi:Ser/Thr protein kinase RdoA (MazF antagonist)